MSNIALLLMYCLLRTKQISCLLCMILTLLFLVAPKKTSCVALISSFLSYGRCMQEAQSRVYPVTQGRLKRWPSIGLQHVSSFLSHGQVINQSNCLSIITKGNSCLDGLYANQKKIPNRNSGYVHLVQVQLGSCTMQG